MEIEMNDDIKDIPLVSIVVPIYNAEKYIVECIESILKQTYSNFELLLIIDGSTDKSYKICNFYEKKDCRIKVIEKKNGGVSSARNVGIKKARGMYILFIDADDYIKSIMVEKMLISSMENNADIVFCGFEVSGSQLIMNDTNTLKILKNCSSKECIIKAIISTTKYKIQGYIWRILFKRELLIEKNIRFPLNINISEDFMFLLLAVDSASKITVLDEEFYVYRVNETSVTTKYIPTFHSDMLEINRWMYREICNKYTGITIGYHCCVANTYLRTIQNLCRNGSPFNYTRRVYEAIKIKKIYNYEKSLGVALKQWKFISNKNKLSYLVLFLNLDLLYILLFSFKVHKI